MNRQSSNQACVAFCKKTAGFTLIEMMLVMVLIGLMVTAVSINPFNNQPEKELEQASARFAGIFNIAAEYGLLNNIELGLIVEKDGYQFLGYDGTSWRPIPEQDIFQSKTLPEGIELTLELDDLPIENEQVLLEESSLFAQDDEDFRGQEKEKVIIPQVFLLSGGDFTSFKLRFAFSEEFELERATEYQVIGLFTLPLKVIGPLYDGEEYDAAQIEAAIAEKAGL